jgi:hypothetical protein
MPTVDRSEKQYQQHDSDPVYIKDDVSTLVYALTPPKAESQATPYTRPHADTGISDEEFGVFNSRVGK